MSAYKIEVSITPLCPSCGKECHPGSFMTESRPSRGIFERDNPYERTDRRVFIAPCDDCFIHRAAVAEVFAAAHASLAARDLADQLAADEWLERALAACEPETPHEPV